MICLHAHVYKNRMWVNWLNYICRILVILRKEKIVLKSSLCWECVAVQEREADHEHDGWMTSRL